MLPYFKELTEAGVQPFCAKTVYSIILSPETEWVKYFNFTACSIDPEKHLLTDSFYSWLYQRHRYKAGVLCMESKTVYNWHRDSSRGTCINTVLPPLSGGASSSSSATYFRNSRDTEAVNHQVIEVPYRPGVRFIFNNQEDHMVVNHLGIRLVLTLEFDEPKEVLSFNTLLNEIEQEFLQPRAYQ